MTKQPTASNQLVRSFASCLALVCLQGMLFSQLSSDRLPVPNLATLQESQKLIKEIYGGEIAKAKSSTQKNDLARKLETEARGTTDDPGGQYALYDEAIRLAVAAGNSELAMEWIRELSERFQVSVLELAVRHLSEKSMSMTTAFQFEMHVMALCETVESAFREDDLDSAASLLTTARTSLAKINDNDLKERTKELTKDLELRKSERPAG